MRKYIQNKIQRIKHRLKKYYPIHSNLKDENLRRLSTDQLVSLMKHEAHRIEKSVYNKIFETKRPIYESKSQRILKILSILEQRNYPAQKPDVRWAQQIAYSFNELEEKFIKPNSQAVGTQNLSPAQHFLEFLSNRRSTRVWADQQPKRETLLELGEKMVVAASWAPNSGNRQPWRFRIIVDDDEKKLFCKIKENHCVHSPLLIFVGMDERFYGAFGDTNHCLLIDAGAAIMQMILLAHKCGFGTCWNHFSGDFIKTRKINVQLYKNICKELNIPEYIFPVAIVSAGVPAFIPPTPVRSEIADLLINGLDSEETS